MFVIVVYSRMNVFFWLFILWFVGGVYVNVIGLSLFVFIIFCKLESLIKYCVILYG